MQVGGVGLLAQQGLQCAFVKPAGSGSRQRAECADGRGILWLGKKDCLVHVPGLGGAIATGGECTEAEQRVHVARIGGPDFAVQRFSSLVIRGLEGNPGLAKLREQGVGGRATHDANRLGRGINGRLHRDLVASPCRRFGGRRIKPGGIGPLRPLLRWSLWNRGWPFDRNRRRHRRGRSGARCRKQRIVACRIDLDLVQQPGGHAGGKHNQRQTRAQPHAAPARAPLQLNGRQQPGGNRIWGRRGVTRRCYRWLISAAEFIRGVDRTVIDGQPQLDGLGGVVRGRLGRRRRKVSTAVLPVQDIEQGAQGVAPGLAAALTIVAEAAAVAAGSGVARRARASCPTPEPRITVGRRNSTSSLFVTLSLR